MPKPKQIMTFGDIVQDTICSLPWTITKEEEKLFNSYPLKDTVPVLKKLVDEPDDNPDYVAVQSRALDALLKLKDFDNIGYLIELYDSDPIRGYTLIEKFSDFDEPRSIAKLCQIAKNNPDPDHRFQAVFVLFLHANPTTLETLEWVAAHDNGEDYEGAKVSSMAQRAIEKIHNTTQSD